MQFPPGGGTCELQWTPAETISAPITLYSEDETDDKVKKKSWTLQLVGIFDRDGKQEQKVLGSKEFDLGTQFKEERSRSGLINLQSDHHQYESAIRLRLSVMAVGEGAGSNGIRMTRRQVSKSFKVTAKNSCVLLLGTTGTGKTSTLNIFTGNSLPTGSDAHSVTDKTTCVKDNLHSNGVPWIDNPGKLPQFYHFSVDCRA